MGSTSITTDASGTVTSELRYRAFGVTRYTSGTLPTKYRFTGQYSHTSDFDLYYYGARWYDPALGRFIQADTIIPDGVQGLDRYAYVNNSPLNYVDPSGHNPKCGPDGTYCAGGKLRSRTRPTYVDPNKLTSAGLKGYETYLKLFNDSGGWWWDDPNLGSDGNFTVRDFVTMNFYEEVANYYNSPNFSAWKEALVRSYYSWKQAMPSQKTSGNAGLLNFTYAQAGAKTRTEPSNFDGGYDPSVGLPMIQGLVDAMIDPAGTGHRDWAAGCVKDAPCRVGSYSPGGKNLDYIEEFLSQGCQPSYLLDPVGCSKNQPFLFMLDANDSAYWDQYRK